MPAENDTSLGHFKLDCAIGEQGDVIIYRAEDTSARRAVWLRIIDVKNPAQLAAARRDVEKRTAVDHGRTMLTVESDGRHSLVESFATSASWKDLLALQ